MAHKVTCSYFDGGGECNCRPAAAAPADPGTRGLAVGTCDIGHQAIAFAGTCPLCRRQQGHSAENAQGHMIYAADLERILRAHYAAGGAGARQG